MSLEARPIGGTGFTRKCVIAKLREMTIDKYKSMVQSNVGGLLVLLPEQLGSKTISEEDKEHMLELEQDLMEEETQIPVYFTAETQELTDIYDDVLRSTSTDQASSALEALLSSATSNGFQLVVAGTQQKALNDFQIVNIQGKLAGYGIEEQLPTIAIVAHYDAYGVAPSLAFGSDSNGSGVVALLELARLFSRLYSNSRTHAKFNLLFLLSGAGKFNFQGTKRWLEDQIESGEAGLLSDVAFVICLDTLGAGDDLYAHVSKPPKAGSATELLIKSLEKETTARRPDGKFAMVHKKINLAEDYLAWEHERFSIRRLPALTVSHLESYKDPLRNTILDSRNKVDDKIVVDNIKIIAEALGQYIYNLSAFDDAEMFTGQLKVESELVTSWLDYLCNTSRAAQLMTKDSPVLLTLEQAFTKHLKDVKKFSFKADKRDPEVIFYSGAEYTMNAYSVKPAVFDLFLAVCIAAYLSLLYFVTQKFYLLYGIVKRLQSNGVSKKTQ